MDFPNGQERRAWLERQGQRGLDALSYYLGPGVPVEPLAQLADMFNPVADIGRAGTAARGVVRPGATVSERVNALGNVATDMASVLAPVAGAAYADDAARGLTEALANWSMPADDAVTRFVVDQDGAIRAWHGSPHDFDRFSMDKIGTGEGAQAYGHGLYFAETPEVAKSYQMMGANVTVRPEPDGRLSVIAGPRGGTQEVIGTYDNADDAFRVMKEQQKSYGRLYEVNIDANPDDFLDWDAPWDAQPESVRNVIWDQWRSLGGTVEGRELPPFTARPDAGIQEILGSMNTSMSGGQGAGERALREAGIPGIRYLDAGSRGAGDGSRNYVVFDDRLVDILGKDGQRTTPQGKAQDVLDMLAAGRASEVTDEMLDLGDPVLNAQLNEYLFRNYDLPMDEGSRMARAREMGLTFDTFHGSPMTGDIAAMSPSRSGEIGPGVYHTRSPAYANEYAVRYDADGDPAGMGKVLPLRTVEPNMMKRREWVDQRGAEMDAIRAERGGEWSSDIPGLASDRMAAKTGGNVYYDGTARMDDQGVTLDPRNIRSRFARFDPRLAHLRNLSAGVGGLGIASLPYLQQDMQAYLDSLPES